MLDPSCRPASSPPRLPPKPRPPSSKLLSAQSHELATGSSIILTLHLRRPLRRFCHGHHLLAAPPPCHHPSTMAATSKAASLQPCHHPSVPPPQPLLHPCHRRPPVARHLTIGDVVVSSSPCCPPSHLLPLLTVGSHASSHQAPATSLPLSITDQCCSSPSPPSFPLLATLSWLPSSPPSLLVRRRITLPPNAIIATFLSAGDAHHFYHCQSHPLAILLLNAEQPIRASPWPSSNPNSFPLCLDRQPSSSLFPSSAHDCQPSSRRRLLSDPKPPRLAILLIIGHSPKILPSSSIMSHHHSCSSNPLSYRPTHLLVTIPRNDPNHPML